VSGGEPATPATPEGSVLAGVLFALALNVVGVIAAMVPFSMLDDYGSILALALPGALQVIWLTPLYLLFKRRGRKETAKGVLILAGIVFLLNAGCWGMIGIGQAL